MTSEKQSFNTPILFLLFNRPDTTQKVFNSIREIKPKYLFVSADGPRPNSLNDLNDCNQTRKILDQIDWECNLKTLFREKNMGCKKAIKEGIDWFFEHVDKGIIIEDDCLPSKSFYSFCEELLNIYENDNRIMMISGYNALGKFETPNDYLFSKIGSIWGWATWKKNGENILMIQMIISKQRI